MFSKKLVGAVAVLAAAATVSASAGDRAAAPAAYIDETGIPSLQLQNQLQMENWRVARTLRRPRERRVLFTSEVRVGDDGNGVAAASFATTLERKRVRYALVVDNGCATAPEPPGQPCVPAVDSLDVTVNGEMVIHAEQGDDVRPERIALNPVGADLNQIVMSARGVPRAGAQLRIVAFLPPVGPGEDPCRVARGASGRPSLS